MLRIAFAMVSRDPLRELISHDAPAGAAAAGAPSAAAPPSTAIGAGGGGGGGAAGVALGASEIKDNSAPMLLTAPMVFCGRVTRGVFCPPVTCSSSL